MARLPEKEGEGTGMANDLAMEPLRKGSELAGNWVGSGRPAVLQLMGTAHSSGQPAAPSWMAEG